MLVKTSKLWAVSDQKEASSDDQGILVALLSLMAFYTEPRL